MSRTVGGRTPGAVGNRRAILVGAVCIVLVLGAYVLVRQIGHSSGQWRTLEERVSSSSLADQSEALDPSVRRAFLENGKPLLPQGASLTALPDSFKKEDSGVAELDAEVDGSGTQRWRLVLIEQADGQWLIYEARRVADTS